MFWSFTNVDHVSACAIIFSKYHLDSYVNCLYTKLLLGCSVLWKQCILSLPLPGPSSQSPVPCSVLLTEAWPSASFTCPLLAHLPKVPAHPGSLCLPKWEETCRGQLSFCQEFSPVLAWLCVPAMHLHMGRHGGSLHSGGIVLLICLQPRPDFLFIECGSMLFCSAWLVVSDSLSPQLTLIA